MLLQVVLAPEGRPRIASCDCTYRDLKDELLAVVLRLEGVQNGRQLGAVELDCKTISGRVRVKYSGAYRARWQRFD